jgi:hypothetical protein
MNKLLLTIILSTLAALPASAADTNLARVQSKLSLLGFEPGPADGLIGRKTRAAISSFDATIDNQEIDLEDLDRKLTVKIQNNAKLLQALDVFVTTSNYTEMKKNEAYFLMGDDFYRDQIEVNYQFAVSKWYFANVQGDDESELIVFGGNEKPLIFRPDSNSKISKNCQSGSKILVFEKVKETYAGDLRYRELDSAKVFGEGIKSYGDTVTLTSDFNGDGFNDFFIPSESDPCAKNLDIWYNGTRDVLLLSNNGDGYDDVTDKYEFLIGDTFRHWAVSGDIDNDGDIDIITSHIGKYGKGDRVECYLNDGVGNFEYRNCVNAPKSMPERNRSWGGALIDLNSDGFLDLVYSGVEEATPVIMLGDGTGNFDGDKSLQLFLSDKWQRSLQQFGGLWVADVDNDGWQDLLFSVQGSQKTVKKGTKCSGYCGTAAGWFRNDHGFLDFQEYFLKFEPNEPFQWPSTSLFSVGHYVRNIENGRINEDPKRPNDIWLRRNYYGKSAPFFQVDKKSGAYVPIDYDGFLITVPRIEHQIEYQ